MLKAMKDAEKQNCLDIAKQIAKLERLLKEEALADGHEADLDTMDEKERRLNEIAVQAVAELPLTVLNFKFQKTGLTKSTCQKKRAFCAGYHVNGRIHLDGHGRATEREREIEGR